MQSKLEIIPPDTIDPSKKLFNNNFGKNTYMIVSKVAFLLGIQKQIFEDPYKPFTMDEYTKLETDKNARLIRNLCGLRTTIELNYGKINTEIYYNLKNLDSLPDLVPPSYLEALEEDGIRIVKANHKLNQYIIDINRYISDRINNCKTLFPIWLNWNYLREIFIMPDGLNEIGIKNAATEYYAHLNQYPYRAYLNWPITELQGNILYNDEKFVTLLYEIHGDSFSDRSKVTNANNLTKDNIYDFLKNSEKTTIIVDCENSDPYKLYATLSNLDEEELLKKINKIILFNDIHAATAWKILNQFTSIPIDHQMVERIKESKSLVDIKLTAATCREHYVNGINSFILVSSDSDYWGLISTMPEIQFFVMVERKKCGSDIKEAFYNAGITYCYIDEFWTGNSSQIMTSALIKEIKVLLTQALDFNIQDILENAYRATRVESSETEKKQFYNRYIKPMKLSINTDGKFKIELGQ